MFHAIIQIIKRIGSPNVYTRPQNASAKKSVYEFKMKALDGKEIDFSRYRGKKILIVNTASKCSYTPQYKGLQKLEGAYSPKLAVLGFPANDFWRQEPGSNSDIGDFCQKNYGVTFQLFEKSSVIGPEQNPLYKWLTTPELNGWNSEIPRWNFCKYLIDENGELTHFFNYKVHPMSEEIKKAIV